MKKDFPRTREGQIEKFAQKCIHFNGIQHKVCEAGIDYSTIDQKINSFVCFGEKDGCAKFQPRGIDAARKYFDEADSHILKTLGARKIIMEELKRRADAKDREIIAPRDTHRFCNPQPHYFCGIGKMTCPVCKTGTLQYSRSTYNGHIHARCSTEGCVAWME